MRKLIVFLVFMNFLLLGGGQYLNAETHQSSHHYLEKRHRVKFTSQDQGSSIIEDADVDLDEEFLGNDNLKDGLSNKFFATTYSILDSWYLTISRQIVVNSVNRFEIFGSSCGQSNPIYITQRVLRI
ncbi:hypothetical protein SAMN05444397_102414 [Flavobacterium aquidurense]|uniref:Uncharacterized protein n=1 Tax=Flavobacterium frigidimaris TaxID=262320 RepID=A0ABX4BNQ6_FLAFR|nr:hypothetical protein [Flavobacterium frigidimaris]OXA77668.1 hypothetical protein B0A65_15120 [Flavobacterium frigidimaris]SDY84856.1 hypothetical protein SAMN05444397_102414 [Flavobacterium aquidurense]